MPRRRWCLALSGAGMNVCLLSGCLFGGAEKIDEPLAPDPILLKDPVTQVHPKATDVPSAPVALERPLPPPEPPRETQTVTQVIALSEEATPAPPAQPPQPLPDPPAIAALRAYLDKNPNAEAARTVFERLKKTDREVLDILFPLIDHAFTQGLDAEMVSKHLKLLEETLPRPTLTLSKVCFTRNIEGFGVYEPLCAAEDVPVFQGGADGRPGERVQVYVEVRNFASRKIDVCWETALSSTLEFRKVDRVETSGTPDVQLQRPARPDRSLSPRQDFYLTIQFHVPPKLPPGLYSLRITVADEIGAAGSKKPNDFRVLAFRIEPPR